MTESARPTVNEVRKWTPYELVGANSTELHERIKFLEQLCGRSFVGQPCAFDSAPIADALNGRDPEPLASAILDATSAGLEVYFRKDNNGVVVIVAKDRKQVRSTTGDTFFNNRKWSADQHFAIVVRNCCMVMAQGAHS